MKKFVIISLLIFSITCNSIACFASDDFDYGVNKTINIFFTYEDDEGNLLNTTAFDFVPLLYKTISCSLLFSVITNAFTTLSSG